MKGSEPQSTQSADTESAGGSRLDPEELLQKETKVTKSRLGRIRVVAAAGVLGVNGEVVRWYVARLGDGGDEPWGLVALVAALVLTPRAIWRAQMSNTATVAAAVLALAAAASGGVAPMLVRAGLVMLAVGVVIGGGAGRVGLLVLSLPVLATAQFYLGYPLRVFTAEGGRPLLALLGVATERVGVILNWSGGAVIVDAPCSGVRMLWTGAVLACGLAAWRRLGGWRTGVVVTLAVAGVLVANALRAALLFMVESGLWPQATWVHEALGAVLFGSVAVGLMVVALRMKEDSEWLPEDARNVWPAGGRWFLLGLGVCAAGWSLVRAEWRERKEPFERAMAFPGWPETFEGKPLAPLATSEHAKAFARGFPGETQVFREGERLVVLRWIRLASRAVHPAADCFRARGYRVEERGLIKDAGGACWSEFRAERGDEQWRVRERWRDARGGEWTDVSAWWWAAQRAGAAGPWWAETVAWRE